METKQTDKTAPGVPETPVRRKVEFDYDYDADMSWLDQDEFRQEKPEDHIALQMSVYELGPDDDEWQLVDSLGGIDCLRYANDWATGTFYRAQDLPEGYLRELAAERLQGEYGAAASLRTIPAQKPTAIETEQPYVEPPKPRNYNDTMVEALAKEHASTLMRCDALAEALREIASGNHWKGYQERIAKKALAAYEESK